MKLAVDVSAFYPRVRKTDRLPHKRIMPLYFFFDQRRSDRQLQHGGVLTFA